MRPLPNARSVVPRYPAAMTRVVRAAGSMATRSSSSAANTAGAPSEVVNASTVRLALHTGAVSSVDVAAPRTDEPATQYRRSPWRRGLPVHAPSGALLLV